MTENTPTRFRNYGDWLIWRATGVLGDFRMPICTSIIATEALRDRWLFDLTEDELERIIARYKEHVNHWNISIDVIRTELEAFARAVNRSYYDVAIIFDRLPPRRRQPEAV
jgi:hypothetical protein